MSKACSIAVLAVTVGAESAGRSSGLSNYGGISALGFFNRRLPPSPQFHLKASFMGSLSADNSYQHQCGCWATSSKPLAGGGEEDIESTLLETQEAIVEILQESGGLSKSESSQIASNTPRYAKMLRDSVRELDELSLWNSWKINQDMGEDGIDGQILSFKKKIKYIAKEKNDGGKIPYLESIGLNFSSAIGIAQFLSAESLPSLIQRVKYVKEIFFSGSDDERLVGRSARRMMLHLSIQIGEDLQQTLSFFEKIDARRGGVELLGSESVSFRHLVESFPRLLSISVDRIKKLVSSIEDFGIQRHQIGNVLLMFPPIIFLDYKKVIKPAVRIYEKVDATDQDFGKMLLKYPWVLSSSIRENLDDLIYFLKAQKVPETSIKRAIRTWPLLLGCSPSRLKIMMVQFCDLGVQPAKLGKIIAKSPQLLLQKPEEFQKVVSFLEEVGCDRPAIGKILMRCPNIFAASVENTLKKKVQLLVYVKIPMRQLRRVIEKYPEVLVSGVDSLIARLKYLRRNGLSERNVALMIIRFPPLLGYSVNEVLRPKLEFLLGEMERPVEDVVEYPRYFSYSLAKRIKPRFLILKARNNTLGCTLENMLGKNDEEFVMDLEGIYVRSNAPS